EYMWVSLCLVGLCGRRSRYGRGPGDLARLDADPRAECSDAGRGDRALRVPRGAVARFVATRLWDGACVLRDAQRTRCTQPANLARLAECLPPLVRRDRAGHRP